MVWDFRSFLQEFICDLVIVLFKAGDALLDASSRPFITTAVCRDMFDNIQDRDPIRVPSEKGYVLRYSDAAFLSQSVCNSTDVCSCLHRLPEALSDQVQRQAAGVVVAHRILNSVPAVILGLFCGAWSDTRGRKLPMMVPSVGSCLAVVFYMLSMQVSHAKVVLLLAGSATQGMFGKSSLICMALSSHVSDTSSPEQRTRRLGRLLGSTFLGVFAGSFLAGFLQDVSGLATTLLIVSLCHVGCILVVLAGITEAHDSEEMKNEDTDAESERSDSGYMELRDFSGDDTSEMGEISEEEGPGEGGERQGEEEEKGRRKEYGLFSWEGLKESLMAVVKKRDGSKRPVIVISLTVLALMQVLKVGDQDVTVLFIQQPPLSWPSSYYGYLIAMDYGVMGFTLLFLLPILTAVLGLADSHVVLLAILCKLVRSLWAGFCTRTWMMFASVACGAFGGLVNAGLRSILSKTASGREVGKLFSIQASLETLAKLVGSAIFTGIYAATVDLYPPAAYLAEVAVYLLMAFLLLWLGHLLREVRPPGLLQGTPKSYSSVSKADKDLKETLLSSAAEPLPTSGDSDNDVEKEQQPQKEKDCRHLSESR